MTHDANMVLTCVFSILGQSLTFTHAALHSLQPLLDFFVHVIIACSIILADFKLASQKP